VVEEEITVVTVEEEGAGMMIISVVVGMSGNRHQWWKRICLNL
jgi:hypothetical protein